MLFENEVRKEKKHLHPHLAHLDSNLTPQHSHHVYGLDTLALHVHSTDSPVPGSLDLNASHHTGTRVAVAVAVLFGGDATAALDHIPAYALLQACDRLAEIGS